MTRAPRHLGPGRRIGTAGCGLARSVAPSRPAGSGALVSEGGRGPPGATGLEIAVPAASPGLCRKRRERPAAVSVAEVRGASPGRSSPRDGPAFRAAARCRSAQSARKSRRRHPSLCEGYAAMSPVVGCAPGCGWSSPPRSSHVSRPLPPSPRTWAGRMSVIAPSPQPGIIRVMRERVVSRPPLIAWVALGDGCRVRRGCRACLGLAACARNGRSVGHGAAAATPERIGGAHDRLEQPVRTWSGRLTATTGAAPGAVRITLPGGRHSLDAGDNAVPSCGAPRRPSAIGARPFAPAPLPANQPWSMANVLGSQGPARGARPARSSRPPGRLRSRGVPVSR